jgi:hypothetical protein
MVHLPKLIVITNDEHQTGVGFALGEIIHFGSPEFIADRVDILSLSAKGSDSGVIFMGIAHSGLPSLHTILEDSANKFDTTASWGGGEPRLPHLSKTQHGDTTTPLLEGSPMPLTVATVPLWLPYYG